MAPISSASHKYSFTVYGQSSTQELIAELKKAESAVGQINSMSFSYYAGDQRDPSSLTVNVSPKR